MKEAGDDRRWNDGSGAFENSTKAAVGKAAKRDFCFFVLSSVGR